MAATNARRLLSLVKKSTRRRRGEGIRRRVPKVPAFGRLLARLREVRFKGRRTPEGVAELLTARDIPTAGPTIRTYEYGWIESPDPVILAGLAALYRIALEDLIAVLHENRRDPSLSDVRVNDILKSERVRAHAEAITANRFVEVGHRLMEIGAELGALGVAAVRSTAAAEVPDGDENTGDVESRGRSSKDSL